MSEQTVRALNVEDLMIASEALDKVVSNMTDDQIQSIMSGNDGNAQAVAMTVIKLGLKHAREDMFKLLAGVNDMEIDEFKKLPANSVTETLTAVYNDERNSDFLQQLRSIFANR